MAYITRHKALAHLDRLSSWKAGFRPAPVTIEWDLSNACSLGCQSCHFAHTHLKGPWAARPRALPMAYEDTGLFADVDVVEQGLMGMARAGVKGVIWSGGGEPTLHTRWREIVRLAGAYGFQQGMYTLGGHITKSDALLLAGYATWVVVSLDAADAATYAAEKGVVSERFQHACDGIRAMVEAGVTVGVSFLLHASNWTRAHEMVLLARRLGAKYATLRPTIETSPDRPSVVSADTRWVRDALPTLVWLAGMPDVECDPDRFSAYADWQGHGYQTCHGIKLSAVVTPDGRMWVCPQRRGVAGSCLGDLRTERFEDIWARHPGQWTDFAECRAMCRMHLTNQVLSPVFASYAHEAFV
jgi:MoaA/NifB/PqqE/SkfB family radical SAM enzyme